MVTIIGTGNNKHLLKGQKYTTDEGTAQMLVFKGAAVYEEKETPKEKEKRTPEATPKEKQTGPGPKRKK